MLGIRYLALSIWHAIPFWVLLFCFIGATLETTLVGMGLGWLCVLWAGVRGSRWILKSLGATSLKSPELERSVRQIVWKTKDTDLIHANPFRIYRFSEVTEQAFLLKPFFGKSVLVLSSGILTPQKAQALEAVIRHATRLSLRRDAGLWTVTAALMGRAPTLLGSGTRHWMDSLMGARALDQRDRRLDGAFSALAVCILSYWNSMVRKMGMTQSLRMENPGTAVQPGFGWGMGFQMGVSDLCFFAPHTAPTQDLLSWSSR
ncbi:MAG: hypothetical protein JNL01_11110 [Bdellovibrionales bacterium]|nr:hypothetical protein [Bdellovibrionales bacterium]